VDYEISIHERNITCADGETISEFGVCGNIRGLDDDGSNDADPSTPFRFKGVVKLETPAMLGASALTLVFPGSFLGAALV
jgi:hypothetical protein